MTRRITPLVAVLGASTLGLAVALTAVLATAGDDDNNRSNGIMMTADMPGYAGDDGRHGLRRFRPDARTNARSAER